MNLRRISIGILAIASLLLASNPAISAFNDSRALITPPKTADGFWAPGYIGVDSTPAEQLFVFPSYLLKFDGNEGSWSKVTACTSMSAPGCLGGTRYSARAELQPCSTTLTSDCLKEFIVKDSNGNPVTATLVTDKVAPFPQSFTGDPGMWLPTGGDPLIYSIPAAPHASGDLYMVKPDVLMRYEPSRSNTFQLTKFEAGIYPIKIVPIKSNNLDENKKPLQSGASTRLSDYAIADISGGPGNPECDGGLNDGKNCIFTEGFPSGFTFGLSLRLSQSMYGWLHGRINNPDVQVTENPVSKTGIDLKIVAQPLAVPVIGGVVKTESAPAKLVSLYSQTPRYGGVYFPMGVFDRDAPLATVSVIHGHFDPSEATMSELRDWLNLLGDTSYAEPTSWLVSTILNGNNDSVKKCTDSTKELAGLVTTNASAYLPGPPSFDSTQGTLDYKVMAPHFASDKSVFLGTYNLIINAKLARCIYGFTNAPIGATVSVVASDGTNRVATTVITQDSKFVRLSAAGFEFSDPTVKVKITQDAPVVKPTPASGSSASSSSGSKTVKSTITCVKGKSVKKVIAVNPKCPAGFKKK